MKKSIFNTLLATAALALTLCRGLAFAQIPQEALAQMEIAFEGTFTRDQIKQRLDKAMKLYNVPRTQENYSRAGSVLITMRKDHGVSEMAILDYMIRSYVPGMNLSFPQAAAFAAVFLAAGDR